MRGQRRAQGRTAAIRSDVEQVLIAETEQRAAQYGGERKVVVRQQQRIGQRHEVHHRDVLGQHEAIGARYFDAFVFQRADDGLEQRAALAHQYQHIAVSRRTALKANRLARVDQPPHGARNAARKLHPRADFAHRIERRVPAFDRLALLRLDGVPDFDTPGGASGSAI